jgi:hypothetical protein
VGEDARSTGGRRDWGNKQYQCQKHMSMSMPFFGLCLACAVRSQNCCELLLHHFGAQLCNLLDLIPSKQLS